MLILQGGRALSSFRIQSLVASAQAAGIQIRGIDLYLLILRYGSDP